LIVPLWAQDTGLNELDAGKAYQLAANWIVDHDPKHQAWAAELIARHRLEALQPELLRAFHDFAPSESGTFSGTPGDFAIEAVADALIKLNVPVPAKDARRPYPEFPALAMILLAQTSDDNKTDLLSIFQETRVGEVWLASANLLAEDPPAGFVAQLVDDFRIFVRILVSEPGHGGDMSYGDCYLVKTPPTIRIPAGWPMISGYAIQLARNGGVVFAQGTNAVSYFTPVNPDPLPWTGRSGCGGLDIQDVRRDLIVQLSGIDPKTAKLRSVVLRDVVHESDQQCRQAIVGILQEQLVSFEYIIDALRLRDLLTQSGAALPPRMEVWVVPLGGDPRLPELPPLANLGITGEYHDP